MILQVANRFLKTGILLAKLQFLMMNCSQNGSHLSPGAVSPGCMGLPPLFCVNAVASKKILVRLAQISLKLFDIVKRFVRNYDV